MDLKKLIREIQDYPKPGINFKDITTLLQNPEAFNFVVDRVVSSFEKEGITKVVCLEARGFIFGGAVASRLGAGFVPVRKKGKLPAKVLAESYELEYGMDTIEMHADSLSSDDVVLIHDDVLATGGTALAAMQLVQKFEPKHVYLSFLCDLAFIENEKKIKLYKYNPDILVSY